ncbi:hypothetical protein HNY73_012661 [Argiope bruennichi]|uniref:Uncharacterized protein n=1 Tax=Argiope bruennichi TaxID=94029 RepID=A0A8T0EVN5_ARGBR|nr:hypothetical protein HNY73_012661 [Argiope bruennichi]
MVVLTSTSFRWTAKDYRIVCQFQAAVGSSFIFMDNNVSCPCTNLIGDFHDTEYIQLMVRFALSPNLNLKKNVGVDIFRQLILLRPRSVVLELSAS